MSSLPAGTPIILFCLDNSIFLAASEEGGLAPISKCVPEDNGYHVKGALWLLRRNALSNTHLSFWRELWMNCERVSDLHHLFDHPTTSVGPAAVQKIMSAIFSDLEFLSSILSGLTKLKFLLRKKLAPATVLDGIKLIYGRMWSRSW